MKAVDRRHCGHGTEGRERDPKTDLGAVGVISGSGDLRFPTVREEAGAEQDSGIVKPVSMEGQKREGHDGTTGVGSVVDPGPE
jgi:hypothetical protein